MDGEREEAYDKVERRKRAMSNTAVERYLMTEGWRGEEIDRTGLLEAHL